MRNFAGVLRQFASNEGTSKRSVQFHEEEGQPVDFNSFWTWSGRYVGYRSSDCLFDGDGRQVGYFAEGDEVYGSDGSYIGEVRGSNRLITNLSKKKWTRGSFTPRVLKVSPGHGDVSAKTMLTGFEDFALSRIAS